MSLYEKFRKMPFIEIVETGAFKKFYSESKYSKMSDEEKESTYAESLQDFMTHVRDLKITKNNIADYYEFMSSKDKNKNARLISAILFERCYSKEFDRFLKEIPMEVLLKNSCDRAFGDLLVETSYFGIRDTLKPIDEYIAEIKESEAYKEYQVNNATVSIKEVINNIKEHKKSGTISSYFAQSLKTNGDDLSRAMEALENGCLVISNLADGNVDFPDVVKFQNVVYNESEQSKHEFLIDCHNAISILNNEVSSSNKVPLLNYESEFNTESYYKTVKSTLGNHRVLSLHQKIQNNEEVPSSEFSKIDFESEAFSSLDDNVKETITNYVNERSDAINANALEKDKQQNTSIDVDF